MDAQCISNTTRVCLKALEKHFFLPPLFQLLHVAAQTAPPDAALSCTSIPAVATTQRPTKPQLLKSLLALAFASMLNQDTLVVHREDLLLVHQEDPVATDA